MKTRIAFEQRLSPLPIVLVRQRGGQRFHDGDVRLDELLDAVAAGSGDGGELRAPFGLLLRGERCPVAALRITTGRIATSTNA